MLQGKKWNELLQNGKNKEEIIKLIFKFVQCEDGRKQLKQPLIITEGNSTHFIEGKSCKLLHECNHEEAEMRLVLNAVLTETNTVIVSKGTDVLIFLLCAFNKLDIKRRWLLK